MLQAFIVVFREGFESFLIVGIILAYLRRIGEHRLVPAMYWGIAASLLASGALGYMLNRGVNESLWEGLFGIATIILVGSLVIHMWKAGAKMKTGMEAKLKSISSRTSRKWAFVGVFLFTVVMITKEGMETVLMLFQIHDPKIVSGIALGVIGTVAISWAWVNFGHLINVRRFFNFVEKSIEDGTHWVVFEPNDESLWQRIARNVTAFLTTQWRIGALFGSTPDLAFYVKCDAETNPPDTIDAGQVITEIGMCPVKPAEFVIFRVTQLATGGA